MSPPTPDRRSEQPSALDRRRDKAQAARAAADEAAEAVARLDGRLTTNAQQTEEQEGALQRALDEAERLRKLRKAGAKERE